MHWPFDQNNALKRVFGWNMWIKRTTVWNLDNYFKLITAVQINVFETASYHLEWLTAAVAVFCFVLGAQLQYSFTKQGQWT